jgi:hypothetical protein
VRSPAGEESRGGIVAYTLLYPNELRNQIDYLRDIKEQAISEESLELAESLIAKRSSPSIRPSLKMAMKSQCASWSTPQVNHVPNEGLEEKAHLLVGGGGGGREAKDECA